MQDSIKTQSFFLQEKQKEIMQKINIFLKTIGTNLIYHYQNFGNQSINSFLELIEDKAYLLGEIFTQQDPLSKIEQFVFKMAWFTYRKNFPEIISRNEQAFITDANWGCTIRVAQMFLFNLFLKQSLQDSKDLIQNRVNLLMHFLDLPDSHFSVHQFCSMADERLNALTGHYWKPNITFFNMIQLVQKAKEIFQNENGLKLSKIINKQAFYLSTDGMITLEEIIESVYEGDSVCRCSFLQSLSPYCSSQELSKYCWHCDFQKTLSIFCFFRTGLYHPEQKSLECIQKLIQNEFFSGGLIGKNNSAYFLIGSLENKLLYLDPHFLQDFYSQDFLKLIRSYEVQKIQTMRLKDINPSMGLFFTLQSFKDCLKLQQFFEQLKNEFPEHYCVCFNLYKDSDL